MSTKHFYATGEIGTEYTTPAEIWQFLQEHDLSVDNWRDTMYRTVATPPAVGELRTAREIYNLILEVYRLVHEAAGNEPLT